jgi:hypothetical protein
MDETYSNEVAPIGPTGTERGYSWWHVLPTAALAIAVAVTQQYFAHTQNLTPWKGGGFGMFSTIDSRGTRVIEISLVHKVGNREEVVRVPVPSVVQPVRDAVSDLKSLPTQARLDDLAYNLARLPWATRKGRKDLPPTAAKPEAGLSSSGDEASDTKTGPDTQLSRNGDESTGNDDDQASFDAAFYVEPDARPGDPRLVDLTAVIVDAMIIVSTADGTKLEKKRMLRARSSRPDSLK